MWCVPSPCLSNPPLHVWCIPVTHITFTVVHVRYVPDVLMDTPLQRLESNSARFTLLALRAIQKATRQSVTQDPARAN